ncbi:phage tail protein [Mesorhizobium sp. M2A.F.Ca.ET.039.01.1.1]|uniref:phage tail protein n=1 Tax=Mesorhizobium sp. M2A.F.Ca.ET.039.01.1.1 TaxID=2496746 RepID=UPI000FCC23F5|nr:phage tail protein [Mesorhizobium sp. M2A.F.Ca.ET.039.01.1.1]RWX72608.1 phage tail protein [Mesorhizobium sp. M2A.F.Ca.ET.039.01.1.1]
MLAQLGAVQFELYPLNANQISHDAGADYAEKSVMGRRPPLEFVGEASESWTISAKLFPHKFGGLSSLEALSSQRQSGSPMPFIRGDGEALGWVVIDKITERSSYLDAHGVGKVIEVDISLKRSDGPSLGNVFSIIQGLLG